jgi:hypothetical protein
MIQLELDKNIRGAAKVLRGTINPVAMAVHKVLIKPAQHTPENSVKRINCMDSKLIVYTLSSGLQRKADL